MSNREMEKRRKPKVDAILKELNLRDKEEVICRKAINLTLIREVSIKHKRKIALSKAKIEAEEVLEQKGFKKIFRFNSIWFLRVHNPVYDYYAEKDGRWSINITTGKKKKLYDDKYSRKFKGYRVGNLHKGEDGEWEFTEIDEETN